MKFNGRSALFPAYGLVVLGLILLARGGALPWEPMKAAFLYEPFGHLFFPERQTLDGFQPTYTYLSNPQRNPQDFPVLPPPFRKAWYTEAYNVDIHSASKGSPGVDDSGIYVGSDGGYFMAFNHDGTLRWRFLIGRHVQGFHGSPLLDQHRVYIGAYNGRLYCFDKITGALIWAVKVADAIGSSPLMLGKDLIVSAETETRADGYLLKIDARSGEVLWRSVSFQEQVHSSPTLSADGSMAFVGDNKGNYHGIATLNGKVQWTTRLGNPIKGTAAYSKGILYVASWDKFFWALKAQTGEVLWRVPLSSRSQSSPLLIGDVAVLGSHLPGHLYGIDIKRNKKLWEKRIGEGFGGMSSAVGVRLGPGRSPSALAYCGNKQLCFIDPPTGRIQETLDLPAVLTGVPTIYKNSIFVSLNRGGLLRIDSAPREGSP